MSCDHSVCCQPNSTRRTIAKTLVALLAAACLSWMAPGLQAADAKGVTTINIEGLHCAGCAKKVTKTLTTIKNVATVKIDVDAATATVTPIEKGQPSPKELWEAVEKSGFEPTKLVGPTGTFTAKPGA